MTKPLEAHIAELQDVIDGPAGRYWCHAPAVSALIAALERSQKQNADLQRDELAAAAAKELRRVENLYTESQKRVAELEARPVAPIHFKENADADFCREWAWGDIKKDLPTENWSISDGAAFYGFYLMGWDSRRQFNEQRRAEALKLFRAAGGTLEGE